ncbi:hypothetical protein LXL04_033244 [Taraxacum kok-saghyz]
MEGEKSKLPLIGESLYQTGLSRSQNSKSRRMESRSGIDGIGRESRSGIHWDRLESRMGSILEIGDLDESERFSGDWKRRSRLVARIWYLCAGYIRAVLSSCVVMLVSIIDDMVVRKMSGLVGEVEDLKAPADGDGEDD